MQQFDIITNLGGQLNDINISMAQEKQHVNSFSHMLKHSIAGVF